MSLYVGSTNDLEKRLHRHNSAKSGAHYTKIRRPVVLRYSEQVSTYAEARAREAEIKRFKRAEKLDLIQNGIQKQDNKNMFSQPIILVLDNVRSVQNVASLFRIADCVGVVKIILGGITPAPVDRFQKPRKDFVKISLGAEKNIVWESVENIVPTIKKYKKDGFEIVALEQTKNSISYTDFKITKPTILILGAEVEGVSKIVLEQSDVCIEIMMVGKKESLNVAVSGAIALFRLRDL
jgi:tRNA G18 (ribose-2'-O)-methylase SpoU